MAKANKPGKANPELCAYMLAQGVTRGEVAQRIHKDRSTLFRWLADSEISLARAEAIRQAVREIVAEREAAR